MREDLAQRLDAISTNIVDIGDQAYRLATALRDAGFAAFLPRQRFIESFAEDGHELELHRRYVVENAKTGLVPFSPWLQISYTSPFLEELKKAAAISPLLKDPATKWIPEHYVDPCEQKSLALQALHPKEYGRREQAMKEQQANQLTIEAQRHSTGLSKRYPFGMLRKASRFEFAEEVMKRELARVEFASTDQKASRNLPVVSKPLGSDWELIWLVGELDLFYYTPKQGMFVPILALRAQSNRPKKSREDTFILRHSLLVEGFSTAYLTFNDLDSLETHIKAHAYLYSLVAGDVEAAIIDGMS